MNAKIFSNIFSLFTAFGQAEPCLNAKADGLSVKEMEPARTAMVIFTYPKQLLGNYKRGDLFNRLKFSRSDMEGCLKGITDGDIINVTINDLGGLHINLSGKRERHYNIPLIVPDEEEMRKPTVKPTYKFKVNIDGILNEIKKSSTIFSSSSSAKKTPEWSHELIFKGTPKGVDLIFPSDNAFKDAKIPLTTGWDILASSGDWKVKVTVASKWVQMALEACLKVTNVAVFEVGTDIPLHIVPMTPFKGELSYWIAPRIVPSNE